MQTVVLAATTLACLALLIATIVRSGRLAPFEVGRVSPHTERCGYRTVAFNASFPLARLSLYPDGIVIASLRTFVLPLSDIDTISVSTHLLGKGLAITHRNVALPSPITIWSTDPNRLQLLLNNLRSG